MDKHVVVKVQDSGPSKGANIYKIFSELCGEMFVFPPFSFSRRVAFSTRLLLVVDAIYTRVERTKQVFHPVLGVLSSL